MNFSSRVTTFWHGRLQKEDDKGYGECGFITRPSVPFVSYEKYFWTSSNKNATIDTSLATWGRFRICLRKNHNFLYFSLFLSICFRKQRLIFLTQTQTKIYAWSRSKLSLPFGWEVFSFASVANWCLRKSSNPISEHLSLPEQKISFWFGERNSADDQDSYD